MRPRLLSLAFLGLALALVACGKRGVVPSQARPATKAAGEPSPTPVAQKTGREPIPEGSAELPPTILNPKDPTMKLILIPAGQAIFGSPDGEGADPEHPQFRANLPAFYLGETEVQNAQYKRFVDATGHRPPQDGKKADWENGKVLPYRDDYPVVTVSWDDAQAYCEWAGLRLPTELEWEKGARGTDGRRYPWGNEWDLGRVSGRKDRMDRVGMKRSVGGNPYGLLDMAGNAWEWCADWYDERAYARYSQGDLSSPADGDRRVVRGGTSGDSSGNRQRCAYRRPGIEPFVPLLGVGFRVARTP